MRWLNFREQMCVKLMTKCCQKQIQNSLHLSAGNFASCCCFNDEIHRIMKWLYTGWHFRIFQQNNGKQYTIYHQIRHQMTTDIYHRESTDRPPTVHRNVTVEVSAERCRVSVDILPECPPRCRSSIVDRISAEITAKSRPRCRSSIGRDIGKWSFASRCWRWFLSRYFW